MPEEHPHRHLHMVLPEALLGSLPVPQVPEGYELRCYADADEAALLDLTLRTATVAHQRHGMPTPPAAASPDGDFAITLHKIQPTILPDGHFVVVHRATGKVVATAMARHRPRDRHPFGGEVGWLTVDPAHRGRRLGIAVAAAATARLIRAGYRRVYLQTDDDRLAAIKSFLQLGFEPFLYADGMAERWERVYRKVGWKTEREAGSPTAARPYAQLQMVWPERLLGSPPHVRVSEGYAMRQYAEGDADAYLELMVKAGFRSWDHEQIGKTLPSVLPDGFFVIVHRETGRLVATAMARHRPIEHHPFGGELSWVAGDPAHARKGLGMAISAAVVGRFLQAGYRRVYLLTDDQRLPAIRTYLKLGFEPFLVREDMPGRWERIYQQLGWCPGK
jgi:mycothiol synthase